MGPTRLPSVPSVGDEDGIDEVRDGQGRLPHHRTDSVRLSQPTQSRYWGGGHSGLCLQGRLHVVFQGLHQPRHRVSTGHHVHFQA